TAVTPPGVWRRWNVQGERACPKKRESPPFSPNKARQSEIPFSHPFNLDGSFHTTVYTSPGSTMNSGLPPCLPDRLLSASGPGNWRANFTQLFMYVFHHAVSHNNGKPKG
ncbi:hypothetical protein JOQ06_014357, partial [Pogonophryne albipinna]